MEREQPEPSDVAGDQAPVLQANLILVVDDEPTIAEAVEFLIEQAGYQPLVAYSGSQALTQTQQHWPALVICDVMMPRMDGPTLVAALREQAAQWQLPIPAIILMTAASPRAVEGVGADAVVQKPFEIDDMEALIHSMMRRDGSAPQ